MAGVKLGPGSMQFTSLFKYECVQKMLIDYEIYKFARRHAEKSRKQKIDYRSRK